MIDILAVVVVCDIFFFFFFFQAEDGIRDGRVTGVQTCALPILRGDAGITSVQDFSKLPPQLRFFAGGDRSIRGYAYQAIGPRNSYGLVIGGQRLLVGSATVEHYFTRDWGIAADRKSTRLNSVNRP